MATTPPVTAEVPEPPSSAILAPAPVLETKTHVPPIPEMPPPKEEPVPDAEYDQDDTAKASPALEVPAVSDAKATPRGGGRAARLLAEDAADERAKDQRFKYLGFSDAPEPEPERVQERPQERASERAAERPEPSTLPPLRANNPRGGGSAVVRFVILAVIAAGAVAGVSALLPRLTQPTPTTSAPDVARPSSYAVDDALSGRLAAIEQKNPTSADDLAAARREINERLTALEGRGPGEAGEGAVTSLGDSVSNQAKQLAAVTARIATLEAAIGNTARLEDLSKRLNMLEGRSAEANSVLALADRVTALESSARRTMVEQSTNIALLMAVAQWRDAVSAGHGFALELQTVKALAARANGPVVDDAAFAAKATRGIATQAELQRRFSASAAEAMRATAIPEGTGAWYRRILSRMMAIVTVRRLDGDAAGTSTSAVLARAERRLAEGDLGATVNELSGLDGGAAQAMAAWLEEATARVATERAIAEATTKAVAAVAATGNTLEEALAPPPPSSQPRRP